MDRNPTPLPAPERTCYPTPRLPEPDVDPMLGEHFADYPLPFLGTWTGRTYPAPKSGYVLVLVVEDAGCALIEALDLVQMSATELRLTRRARKHAPDAFVRQQGPDYMLHDGMDSTWLGESGAEAAWFLGGPASRY